MSGINLVGGLRKRCSQCGIIRAITEFHKKTLSRDGHRSSCKACRRLYAEKNSDKERKRKKAWYETHNEICRGRARQYHSDNREKRIDQQRQYNQKHRERLAEKAKCYRETNKELIRQYGIEWRAKNV